MSGIVLTRVPSRSKRTAFTSLSIGTVAYARWPPVVSRKSPVRSGWPRAVYDPAMKIDPFVMERMQSTWENQVEINLSESGVHPLTLGELIDAPADREALLGTALGYPQTNGTLPLRSAIAAMYPGATPENVHVTNGGSEANFCSTWSLLEAGDDV